MRLLDPAVIPACFVGERDMPPWHVCFSIVATGTTALAVGGLLSMTHARSGAE
jgi:hypothetical protein